MSKYIEEVMEEFDDKVIELNNQCLYGSVDSEVVDFGYRTWTHDEVGTEIFTVVDFGNIRSFIQSALQKQIEMIEGEVESKRKRLVYDVNWAEGYNQALDTTLSILSQYK